MSVFYSTMQEMIDDVNNSEVSYKKLHKYITIDTPCCDIKVPYASLINDYKDFFRPIVRNVILNEAEKIKYYMKPKKMALDIYGTTELWSAIMDLNNIYSVIDFKPTVIKLFDPREFTDLLNEVMIRENII